MAGHRLGLQGGNQFGLERVVEYLLLAAAAIAVLLLILRKRKSRADARFEPTEAQETWGGPEGHFPDTVIADTDQSEFKTTLPGLR